MRYAVILMLLTGFLLWASLMMVWPEGRMEWVVMVALVCAVLTFGACTALYLASAGLQVCSGCVVKRADGRVRGKLNWIVLAPSTALSSLSLALRHRFSGEPRLQEVDQGLFVGRHLRPGDRKRFEETGVTAVVDLCAELEESEFIRRQPGLDYLSVPVLDGLSPSVTQLQRLTDWVTARLGEGKRVMIHCALGHSRSAVAAACVLVNLGRVHTTDEAVRRLEGRRPKTRLHRNQRRAVERFVRARSAQGASR